MQYIVPGQIGSQLRALDLRALLNSLFDVVKGLCLCLVALLASVFPNGFQTSLSIQDPPAHYLLGLGIGDITG
jgi:hypothetical protein